MSNHGIKLVAAAGAVGLALATATPTSATQAQVPHVARPAVAPFGSKPEDRFLWTIMQVESSGGRNVMHKTMSAGIHEGEHAVGRWGIMPNTVREMIERMERDGAVSPYVAVMKKMDSDSLAKYVASHPGEELELARAVARLVLRRQGHDFAKAAYAWNQGHNLVADEVTRDLVSDSTYVKTFKKFQQVNPIRLKKTSVTPGPFRERFKAWQGKRDEQQRKHAPPASNYTPDLGRQRKEELDEVHRAKNVRQAIKIKIDEAKKVAGRGRP